MARPWDNGCQWWAHDPAFASGSFTPTAGQMFVARVAIRGNQPVFVTNINYIVATAGSGAQLPVNCFFWITNSAGTLLANSATAAQDTPMQSTGGKQAAIATPQLLQANTVYYVVGVIGTQSTTAVQLRSPAATASAVNINLVNTTFRFGTQGSGVSAPGNMTPGSIASVSTAWVALS